MLTAEKWAITIEVYVYRTLKQTAEKGAFGRGVPVGEDSSINENVFLLSGVMMQIA